MNQDSQSHRATPEQWTRVGRWAAEDGNSSDSCIIELRARRWRQDGLTYRVIAERLGCSQTTARRLAAA